MVRAVLLDVHALVYGPHGADFLSEVLRGEGIAVEPVEVTEALSKLPFELSQMQSAMRTEDDEDEYNRSLIQPLLEAVGMRFPTDALMIRLAETLHEYHAYWSLYPETLPVLHELKQRDLQLGIVANWTPSLRRFVREFELESYFGAILGSREVGLAKPDPFIFGRALKALGVSNGEAMHCGPGLEEDVAGAIRAGITPVWVNRTGIPTGHEVLTITDLRGLLMLTKAGE